MKQVIWIISCYLYGAAVILLVILLRQYMHNTEIAVTMRLSTILKTIKQPL